MKEERALKIIKKPLFAEGEEHDSEFYNEIKMLKAIDHPNVVKYYEYYPDESNYYIVTELCSGGELIGHILKEKGIDEEKA